MNERYKKDWICPECGLARGPNMHDPCIENLPGVDFACCGHGKSGGYVSFKNGTVIRFIPLCIETWHGQEMQKRLDLCGPTLLEDFSEFLKKKSEE